MAAINPRSKQRERAIQEALETRIAVRFRNQLGGILRSQYRDAAKAMEDGKPFFMAVEEKSSAMEAAFERAYTATIDTFANRLVEKTAPKLIVTKDMRDDIRQLTRVFVDRFVARKVVRVSDTTIKQIAEVVRAARQDPDSTPASISREINRLGEIANRVRAEVIARTEVHSAAGYASNEAAKLLDMDLIKEWVSASDGRERPDHQDVQPVGLDEKFTVGTDLLEYPGDPTGSAEQIINCRCAVIYTPRPA